MEQAKERLLDLFDDEEEETDFPLGAPEDEAAPEDRALKEEVDPDDFEGGEPGSKG